MLRASLIGCWLLTACVPSSGIDFTGDGGPQSDAGPLGVGECVDAGPDCVPQQAVDDCAALVAATCGETCGESPGCAASTLLRDHEPERCAAALTDTQTFPPCALGSCDSLVLKVCGGDPPVTACVDAPGCAPAVELQARAADPAASGADVDEAKAACQQALEDESVFAPCP